MNKLLPSLALVLVAGLAAPVIAAPYVPTDTQNGFNAGIVLNALQSKGVNAVDVSEPWNGKIRATVALDDGRQVFQYFSEDTLAPITGSTSNNTRVLSKLDTGIAAPLVYPQISENRNP